ncbi:MAG: hypothetical protein ACREPI_05835 [Candidatus Dormibacterales bacterium]
MLALYPSVESSVLVVAGTDPDAGTDTACTDADFGESGAGFRGAEPLS